MKRLIMATLAALVLAPLAFAGSSDSLATVTVIQGVPGLPADVDVSINGEYAFSMDYAESVGPLAFEPGVYKFTISLSGTDLLTSEEKLEPGVSYSLAAHLLEAGGLAMSMFKNEISPIAPSATRVTVRHLAQAPPIDIVLRGALSSSTTGRFVARFLGLANSGQAGPIDLPSGPHQVIITPQGVRDLEIGSLRLAPGASYVINAVGTYPDGVKLIVQTFQVRAILPGGASSDD